MKKAILYARNSDPDYEMNKGRESARVRLAGGRAETSVEQQVKEGVELASRLGAAVAPEDLHTEFMTGVDSLFDRPEVNKVRDKIRAAYERGEPYDLFVCYDTDRLARDPIETGLVLKECMKYGCELQFVRMPLENSEVGMILLFMRGYGDRLEAKKFQDRIRRHREACKRAKKIHAANTAPYGYYNDFRVDEVTGRRVYTGTRAVDKEAAQILLRIAEWIAYEDVTGTQAALRLNRERVPSPAARRGYRYRQREAAACKWTGAKVCRLMRDPTYTGKTFVNQYRLTKSKKRSGKFIQEKLPVGSWELLTDDPNVTPAIIPEPLFRLVQEKLDAGRVGTYTTRNNRKPVLLRNLVFCAECGSKMYSTVHHSKTPIYRCSSYNLKDNFKCPGTSVKGRELEEKVWRKVIEFYRAPEIVESEVRNILSGMDTRQLEVDLSIAEGEIAERQNYLNGIIERLMAAARMGRKVLADKLDAECMSVEDEIRRFERMAGELRAKIEAKDYVAEVAQEFRELCAAYREGFLTEEIPFERKRDALAALRVQVLASSKRGPRMRVNLGALYEIAAGAALHPATVARAWRPRP
jgi:DNA invertase Pin-like site-specific DNA recombinase